jgi:hypothetical protein
MGGSGPPFSFLKFAPFPNLFPNSTSEFRIYRGNLFLLTQCKNNASSRLHPAKSRVAFVQVFVLLGWNRAAFWVAARFTLYGIRDRKIALGRRWNLP